MARILLADDDPTTLDLVARTLVADGHEVLRCQDGQEALQQLTSGAKPFDLLLTDVEMPALDGIELARRVAEAKPGIRILLMSGFSDPKQASPGVPIAGFISKPLSLDQLRSAVRSALAS